MNSFFSADTEFDLRDHAKTSTGENGNSFNLGDQEAIAGIGLLGAGISRRSRKETKVRAGEALDDRSDMAVDQSLSANR
jgi:hypothetical protein